MVEFFPFRFVSFSSLSFVLLGHAGAESEARTARAAGKQVSKQTGQSSKETRQPQAGKQATFHCH